MISPATCPICKKPITQVAGEISKTIPFCSKRCQQVDLYRWFNGKYAIVEDLGPEQLAQEMLNGEDLGESLE